MTGTWLGEAQRVRLLAAELGLILDEETLVYYDIHEVMALGLRLQRALRADGGRLQPLGRRASAVPALRRLCRSRLGRWPCEGHKGQRHVPTGG
jgi:hypothetical protein